VWQLGSRKIREEAMASMFPGKLSLGSEGKTLEKENLKGYREERGRERED